jgi:CRP-like cAMP-binding protein
LKVKNSDRDFLKNVSILRDLTEIQLDMVLPHLILAQHSHGATLFRQGDDSLGLFIIREGSVKIYRTGSITDSADVLLCTLTTGDVFGEFSLLAPAERLTTAIVAEDSRIFEMACADFDRLVGRDAKIGIAILRSIGRRVLGPFQRHPDLFFRSLQQVPE